MIHAALSLIATELNAHIKGIDGDAVVPGNIASIDSLNAGNSTLFDDSIVLSVVNLEEESAFKNVPNFKKKLDGTVAYQNPPVYLNLYLLFAANFQPTSTSTKYELALEKLSDVVRFLQGKRHFTLSNSPTFSAGAQGDTLLPIQLILDLYTLTFEQINHLWGSLGGKQMPFVMYKARLVELQDLQQTGSGQLIEEISREEQSI